MNEFVIEILHPLADNILFTSVAKIRDDELWRGVTEKSTYLLHLHDVGTVDGAEDACATISAVDTLVEAVDSCKAVDFAFIEPSEILESHLTIDGRYAQGFGLCYGVAENDVAGLDPLHDLLGERQFAHGEPMKTLAALMEPHVAH